MQVTLLFATNHPTHPREINVQNAEKAKSEAEANKLQSCILDTEKAIACQRQRIFNYLKYLSSAQTTSKASVTVLIGRQIAIQAELLIIRELVAALERVESECLHVIEDIRRRIFQYFLALTDREYVDPSGGYNEEA
ncbi:hypothetical protein SERLA73DRAFT_67949 [Serpula lacrymans var. lacrymans S7.3]|uniref:Uncharacterized protein n=2 Tax=Serpula lacrymans var. lacrymans TaxID=341189 RepID=F8PFP0_SERL3|nr:uncharacterized protein SERLADRAFT_431649 [Serpula lacrymans var. lacrymans S7.9]XP_007317900.1 uncharacterized protein SERLADRAFT_437512 [Serpula lacrymans var. lacrymans S7.9]XP_007321715.1 uncharacterized protein SERLADRAFT_441145 [Serpula lacrymans var. lacrymans S7.9]EGO04241.1 hypothetical protein SERLA73DRAFT_67949 [Serpula lacrymans var. lacrymans S7.3]EGO21929.1 hypothetical protein SERLADRAFT_441145 [Serpula lacrymans var. lacrymans S7.9]EGO25778.1 hypothetical protein SERLADRAFT_